MRLVAVTLALAVLSLGFAPAPAPRRPETAQQRQERQIGECVRRLDAMGVSLGMADLGGRWVVQYSVRHPADDALGLSGSFQAGAGAPLLEAMRELVEKIEGYVKP